MLEVDRAAAVRTGDGDVADLAGAAPRAPVQHAVQVDRQAQPIAETYLSIDKPLYRPGETVYYRSLTLSRFGLRSDIDAPVHFEIRDPSGAIVAASETEGVRECWQSFKDSITAR